MSPLVKTGQHRLPLFSLSRLGALVLRWQAHRSTRNSLARLDRHLLDDIGLSPAARDAECGKSPWQD